MTPEQTKAAVSELLEAIMESAGQPNYIRLTDSGGAVITALEQAQSNVLQREVQLKKALEDWQAEKALREQAQRERDEALAAMSADTAQVVLAKCLAEQECDTLTAKVERLGDMLVTCAQQRETIRLEKHTFAKQIDSLVAKCAKLESERAKWEEGCRVNADNAADALRLADNQRLEIISLRSKCGQPLLDELERMRPAIHKIADTPDNKLAIAGWVLRQIAREALNPEAK